MLFLIVGPLILAAVCYSAGLTCDAVDCTGSKNCSDWQDDECQSDATFITIPGEGPFDPPTTQQHWVCNGACWKAGVPGTIDVCEAATPVQYCTYDGGVACSGNVQTDECETTVFNWVQNLLGLFGEKCAGGCIGEPQDVPGYELHNCS